MVKALIYRVLFPFVYRMGSRRKQVKNRILFVQVRGEHLSGNFDMLYQQLQQREQYEFESICLKNGSVGKKQYLWNCIRLLWHAAAAKYIFLDAASNVLAAVSLREGTILTQLWHGCGAFKKFGYSVADATYGASRSELEKYPYYRNTTYVTVSSPEVIWAFEEATGLPKERIIPVGVSRTDIFFREEFLRQAKEHLLACMPEAAGKKVILYAPTFRGDMRHAMSPDVLDLTKMMERLHEKYVLVCKHHPYVKQPPVIPKECAAFARDLTNEMKIEELLCVSDICISDYSSLIFEYSLFERPMMFLADDIDAYYDERGFYYDYEQMTPGPIVRKTEEVIVQICRLEKEFDATEIQRFREKFMCACDGHATERLIKMVFDSDSKQQTQL